MGLSLQMLSWGVEGEGVLDALAAADRYKALVGQLGSAWRQQKCRASSNDCERLSCKSVEFELSGMPGGSQLQMTAQ
eukprot:2754071-Pleurochrysis_carterae.AAC.1